MADGGLAAHLVGPPVGAVRGEHAERGPFIRTLGWRQSAERDLAALSPEARAALDAYAEGVNAWIADHHG